MIEFDVAALFVQHNGAYSVPGVDPWPEWRDARLYNGPFPVVAHPPCERWGNFAAGGPSPYSKRSMPGEDGGCFESALASVRRWGGVLEHPAGSELWAAAGLPLPGHLPDDFGGWTLEVEQWVWGHRAIKPTWLYIAGPKVGHYPALPTPAMSRPSGSSARTVGGAREGGARSMLERLPKTQRHITPPAFAAWLVELVSQ